jgi:hypothetical protein
VLLQVLKAGQSPAFPFVGGLSRAGHRVALFSFGCEYARMFGAPRKRDRRESETRDCRFADLDLRQHVRRH